jgi:hypothetical protein
MYAILRGSYLISCMMSEVWTTLAFNTRCILTVACILEICFKVFEGFTVFFLEMLTA